MDKRFSDKTLYRKCDSCGGFAIEGKEGSHLYPLYHGRSGFRPPEGEVWYAKRGRKYHPIAEYRTFDGFVDGTYLVDIHPGGQSMHSLAPNVDRKLVKFRYQLTEAISKAVHDVDVAKYQGSVPLTLEEQTAWKVFEDSAPGMVKSIWHPSLHEIATKAADIVVAQLDKIAPNKVARKGGK